MKKKKNSQKLNLKRLAQQLKNSITNAQMIKVGIFIAIARMKLEDVKDRLNKILETNSFQKMLENKQREEEKSEIDFIS